MSPSSEASILFTLPLEIRQQIYTNVYPNRIEPLIILRNDTYVSQPLHRWFDHAGPSILRTSHALYREALPFLYARAHFRIQIYVGDGWPKYQFAGPVDCTNKLLRSIQHVEITLHLSADWHVDIALKRLRLLAAALREKGRDGEGAALKTWKVTFKAVTSYQMAVTRELVASRIADVLKQLDEEGRNEVSNQLFREMLAEGQIVSVT